VIAGTRAWIHLGANFTLDPSRGEDAVPMPRCGRSRSSALARTPRPTIETPLEQAPIGEARNVSDGGRSSITGFNGRFHQTRPLPRSRRSVKAIAFARLTPDP
jgi:hypothetical protein